MRISLCTERYSDGDTVCKGTKLTDGLFTIGTVTTIVVAGKETGFYYQLSQSLDGYNSWAVGDDAGNST